MATCKRVNRFIFYAGLQQIVQIFRPTVLNAHMLIKKQAMYTAALYSPSNTAQYVYGRCSCACTECVSDMTYPISAPKTFNRFFEAGSRYWSYILMLREVVITRLLITGIHFLTIYTWFVALL